MQEKEESPAGEDRSKRQERAERILDAALELFNRWGYKKTTLDDIAKLADVAKGTLYLHWKTREALFQALVLREWSATIVDFRQRLERDPTVATLSGLSKNVTLVAFGNPLFKAILQRDTDMLGDLARSRALQQAIQIRAEISNKYLEQLRVKGLMRDDIDLETQKKMLTAIYTGFFMTKQFSPEEMAEALAITLRRTFEPVEPPEPAVLAEVAELFRRIIDRLAGVVEHQYREPE